jgi:hypothetical protein
MAQKTATQAASNWKSGMAQGGGKWAAGVQNCTVNPMALAAGAMDKAVQNYTAAAPRMAAALSAYPVGNWKAACAAPTATAAYAAGGTKGLPKYTNAVTKLAASVWPQMKAASQAAGGGDAGYLAAAAVLRQAKANGQTK